MIRSLIGRSLTFAAIAAFSFGCRGGFDTPDAAPFIIDASIDATTDAPPPALSLVVDATTVRVECADRFTLGFSEDKNWQVDEWIDSENGALNLAGTGGNIELSTLQQLLIICANGDCVGANAMLNPTIDSSIEDGVAIIDVTWQWLLVGNEVSGAATHRIGVDGSWDVSATATNDSADGLSGSLEVADSHVNLGLNWLIASDFDQERFTYELAAPRPRPTMDVEVTSPGDYTIQSDEMGNRYFVRAFSLGVGESVTATWSNRIWPPR